MGTFGGMAEAAELPAGSPSEPVAAAHSALLEGQEHVCDGPPATTLSCDELWEMLPPSFRDSFGADGAARPSDDLLANLWDDDLDLERSVDKHAATKGSVEHLCVEYLGVLGDRANVRLLGTHRKRCLEDPAFQKLKATKAREAALERHLVWDLDFLVQRSGAIQSADRFRTKLESRLQALATWCSVGILRSVSARPPKLLLSLDLPAVQMARRTENAQKTLMASVGSARSLTLRKRVRCMQKIHQWLFTGRMGY